MSHDFNDNELSFDTRNRIINETLRLIKENPETGPTLTEICGALFITTFVPSMMSYANFPT